MKKSRRMSYLDQNSVTSICAIMNGHRRITVKILINNFDNGLVNKNNEGSTCAGKNPFYLFVFESCCSVLFRCVDDFNCKEQALILD